jgi:pimeloyl-ACP methyl ester carboxylesterase
MRHFVYVILFSVLLPSCLRLDDQLFNNEKLSAYKFDAYGGTKELPDLPASYAVADSMRHLFTLTSTSSEGSAAIYAVYIGNLNTIAADTVILYCHGNAHHMDRYWNRTKLLAHVGGKHHYGVLTLDYRGYGMSGGKPSEKNMYADVDAALKWLQSKGVAGSRVVIYGYSLGSAPATEMSAGNYSLKPSKLVLEAPFASAQVMVNDASRLALPANYFTNLEIDNAEEIKKVAQPFLWMHGTSDDFLDINTHGEVVYRNYRGVYGKAFRVNGAGHENVPSKSGYPEYLQNLFDFIIRN